MFSAVRITISAFIHELGSLRNIAAVLHYGLMYETPPPPKKIYAKDVITNSNKHHHGM